MPGLWACVGGWSALQGKMGRKPGMKAGEESWAGPGRGAFVRQQTVITAVQRERGTEGTPRKIYPGGQVKRGSREGGDPEACSPWTPRRLMPTEPLTPTRPRRPACEEKMQREAWPFGGRLRRILSFDRNDSGTVPGSPVVSPEVQAGRPQTGAPSTHGRPRGP